MHSPTDPQQHSYQAPHCLDTVIKLLEYPPRKHTKIRTTLLLQFYRLDRMAENSGHRRELLTVHISSAPQHTAGPD